MEVRLQLSGGDEATLYRALRFLLKRLARVYGIRCTLARAEQ